MKAEDDLDLIHNVYLQCETAAPFNNVKVHVFDPADGSHLFLPRTGADDEGAAALARALGRDSELLVWVLMTRRPEAVEAFGEDGLDQVDVDDLPCDGQHAQTLRQAARLMHEGMLTPAEEVRSNLSDNILSC